MFAKLGFSLNSLEMNANQYLDQMKEEDQKDIQKQPQQSMGLPMMPPLRLA
jgi:hypothetical protein